MALVCSQTRGRQPERQKLVVPKTPVVAASQATDVLPALFPLDASSESLEEELLSDTTLIAEDSISDSSKFSDAGESDSSVWFEKSPHPVTIPASPLHEQVSSGLDSTKVRLARFCARHLLRLWGSFGVHAHDSRC